MSGSAGVRVEGHPQREYLRRLHTQLRDAMTRNGLTYAETAERAGIGFSTLLSYLYAKRFPSLENAAKLAAALDEPGIVDVVRAHRTRPCLGCGAPVVSENLGSGGTEMYCGDLCRKVHDKNYLGAPGRKAQRFEHLASELGVALTSHRSAVASFCRGCEPEGMCRNARCPLRPVSPLPLARGAAA